MYLVGAYISVQIFDSTFINFSVFSPKAKVVKVSNWKTVIVFRVLSVLVKPDSNFGELLTAYNSILPVCGEIRLNFLVNLSLQLVSGKS